MNLNLSHQPYTSQSTAWLSQPATVSLSDAAGNSRTLAGLVFATRERNRNAREQMRLEVTLRPRLAELEYSEDNRIYQALSIPQIVTRILKQYDILSDSILWRLNHTYAAKQYVVQFQETDLQFIERLLSSVGISYYFTEHENRDILNFVDDNAYYNPLDLGEIAFVSDAGLDKPSACFNQFIRGMRVVTPNALVKDYNHNTPFHPIQAGHAPTAKDPATVHYGSGAANQKDAEFRARIIQQRYAMEAYNIQLKGNVAGLYHGAVLNFKHPSHAAYSGEYVIISMSHRLIQQAVTEHENDLGNLAYTQHAFLIPRSVSYRPEPKPLPQMPTTFTARIESNGQYALLDEQGCFKVRMLFDTRLEQSTGDHHSNSAAHTEASLPIRSTSFHGSPITNDAVGAAFPYRDGVEVIWGLVEGNIDQPIILGCLPNPATQSPVTSRNYADNILRTAGKNELLMHDRKNSEYIELKQGDPDRPFNLLRLDANSAGQGLKFACTLGAMELYAKQTMKIEAGDSLTQTHGNERHETIEDNHSLTTTNKEIHYQSATDQLHHAQNNISHTAGKNIEHKAGANTRWRVSRNAIITIKQGDQIIKIDNGNLHIEAKSGIKIKAGNLIKHANVSVIAAQSH